MNTLRVIIAFFLLSAGAALPLYAQELPETTVNENTNTGGSNNSFALPALRMDTDNTLPLKNNFDLSMPSKEIEFVPSEKFADRGEELEKKLNKKEEKEIKPEYKVDRYLGDFKTGAKFVKVICRDHEFVDGDRVSVYVNDTLVQNDILLDARFYGFEITLEKGFNKVDFLALNQGSSGPNTAEFHVYDDQGRLVSSNRWNLTTGVKATLIIVKE
ncbi:MAG: hypothetical protein KDD04_07265 [Sinomicrobium sp.]|nr:hypothetical protein [Sinomicrobium sp.]